MELTRRKSQREIKLEKGVPESIGLPTNRINTGNHSLHGFLFNLLLNQCTRLSTLWFIFISVIALGPLNLDYQASSVPCILLVIHLLIAVTRDGVTLARRNRADRELNREQFAVWMGDKFAFVPCDDIKVGQCLLVYDKGRIPADCVLLATSNEDGSCYISTAHILGENSLDVKSAVKEFQRTLPNYDNPPSFNFHRLRAVVKVPPPRPDYDLFEGKLKIPGYPRASVLDLHNFLLRGSRLYSTSWILCLVVYTGMETKVWLDRTHAPRKMSSFMRALNYWTICGVGFVLVISALMTLVQYFYSQEKVTGQDFLLYLLGLSGEVPVSLYIGLDLARLLIMWRLTKESKGSVCKYGYMSEDLAKISFVLMDKTGTLTENKLKVSEIVIKDQIFIRESDAKTLITENMNHFETASSPRVTHLDTFDELAVKLQQCSRDSFYYFCECIALCHSVIPVGKDEYKATSADEKALVRAARKLGCSFISRTEDECSVEMFGTCVTYNIICIRKFSPELRRMRVLVQGIYDQHATLYVKGNYAVLKDFIRIDPEERMVLEARLEEMMHKGLRTMLLCYRQIEGEQLNDVKQQALNYRLSRTNMEAKMEILLKELEKELLYIGIVGIKDEVKPDTVECLEAVKSLGLQTWVLSGDSESNTLATAYSLGLLDSDIKVVSMRGLTTTENCARRLHNVAREHLFHRPPENRRASIEISRGIFQNSSLNWGEFHPETVNFALSIDHITLKTALKVPVTRHFLLTLLTTCSCACFNTLHPSDKREVTRLIMRGQKVHPKVLTIGDDGSNMPMILEADVGVGIVKDDDNERAGNNSDISITHFAALWKLLQGGRVNAHLLCQVALLFIYGASAFVLLKLAYMPAANVTPVFLYSLEFSMVYLAVIILLPFVSLSVTNSHPSVIAHHHPDIKTDSDHFSLKPSRVAQYVLLAFAHTTTMIALVLPAFYVGNASLGSTAELSCTFMLVLVLTVNQHCWQEARRHSLWLYLSSVLSIGTTLLYFGTQTNDPGLIDSIIIVFTTPRLLISILCAPLANAVISCLFQVLHRHKHSENARIVPLLTHRSLLNRLRMESWSMLNFLTNDGNASAYEFDVNNLEIDKRRMKFKSAPAESNYLLDFTLNNSRLLRTTALLFTIQIAISIPQVGDNKTNELIGLILGIFAAVILFLSTTLQWKTIDLAQIFAVLFLIGTFIFDILTTNHYAFIYLSIPVGLLLIVKEKWVNSSLIAIITFLTECVDTVIRNWLISRIDGMDAYVEEVGYLVAQALITYLAIRVAYDCDHHSRLEYKLIHEAEEKIGQSENILSCLLPDFVRKRVKDGTRYIAEDKDSVSVLFCEICDFDAICADYSPGELTALLDDVFQKIDELCEVMGVAKIETVGKVYMACSGLSDFECELSNEIRLIPPEQRVVELAFAILSSFRLYKLQSGKTLQLKLGINTGPVIAGVVGHHKPQFSLVGDTVNTASRMSTTITVPNTVQVSPSTYDALVSHDNSYEFQPRSIYVKGKGEMTAYTIRRKTILDFTGSRQRANDDNPSATRNRGRARSSIGDNLRSSVNFNEAVEMNDKDLIEEVVIFPYFSKEQENERKFRLYNADRKLPRIKYGLNTYLIGMTVLTLATFALGRTSGEMLYYVAGTLFSFLLLSTLLIRICLHSLYTRHLFSWMLVSIYVCSAVGLYIELAAASESIVDLLYVVLCCLLVLMYYCGGVFFRHAVLGSLVIVVPWFCEALALHTEKWEKSVYILFFTIQHCTYIYYNEKNKRTFFNLSKLASREIVKTEQLLTQMLPVQAYEGLKDEEWVTDRLLKVTFLYADISGFTAWSSSQSPQEVITQLNEIYTAFDKICVRLKVYKVHTIGDCYVAMSATSNSDTRDPGEECVVMLNFAEEMLKVLKSFQATSTAKLNMRIGLHVGDVVAGIIGTKLIRYDIYGTDVLIANKMESNGAVGCINVSEDVVKVLDERIPGFVDVTFNKTVEVPIANRAVDCYFARNRY